MTSRPGFRLPISRARQGVLRNGPSTDGARRDNIIPQTRARRGQYQRQRPNRGRATQPARHAASDHHPVAAAFHRGCAYTLSKHRERDRAVVRSGEHRVNSDQGTPTLITTSRGIERSDLDRSSVQLPDQDQGRAVVSLRSVERQSSWSAGLVRFSQRLPALPKDQV